MKRNIVLNVEWLILFTQFSLAQCYLFLVYQVRNKYSTPRNYSERFADYFLFIDLWDT